MLVYLKSIAHRIGTVYALATIVMVGVSMILGAAHAGEYCSSLEDYLDFRPYVTAPGAEDRVLQWGREQGVSGLDNAIPAERRGAALKSVYSYIAKTYLGSASVPEKAPDAGVNVQVGKPYVVMFGPEGSVTDQEDNMTKLGYVRWGHYMFPSVQKLRDGRILVRVYIGGDGDARYSKPHEYLNYISEDGGKNWRHYACYDQTNEKPISEIALQLSDGEEIRYRNRTIEIDGSSVKPITGAYYRLGDLPRDLQFTTMFTRKPGVEPWEEEKAYWDPDTLLLAAEEEIQNGEKIRKVLRMTLPGPPPVTSSFLRSDPWASGAMVQLKDGSLVLSVDSQDNTRPMWDLRADGKFAPLSENYVWRSFDRGRTWKFAAGIPSVNYATFFQTRRAHLEPRFPGGAWVALYRSGGMYCSGGGPMLMRNSKDDGKTWSEPKAIRPASAGTITGLMLDNGIAVRAYGRPGVFLMFCGDGTGELWGNDVKLVEPWKSWPRENSCCNPNFTATGPDRFLFVYSKYDVPDPWGNPRQAIIAQEFIVSKK